MNKQDLWNIYTSANPSFLGDKPITMTPAGLKKLFDQTWAQAQQEAEAKSARPTSLFDQIFGSAKY